MATDSFPPTTDPHSLPEASYNAVERIFAPYLRDQRDLFIVRKTLLLSLCVLPAAALLFVPGVHQWWMTPIYIALLFTQGMARYILMLHAVSHRPVFKREHDWMNNYVPWVLGPFFGQTPTSFFTHHMLMHHQEGNLETDLSSTMAYQRDRFTHWLHYWARFFFFGTFHLAHYLWTRNRKQAFYKFLGGELGWLAGVIALWQFNPAATFTVFVLPLMLVRVAFMTGNWAQHSFVDIHDPDNAYKNSTSLTNTRYNHRCYNDGYHIIHHLKPGLHWTEMAQEFERTRQKYVDERAIVFSGMSNNQRVWWLLMTQQYEVLADYVVQMGEQKLPKEAIVALLKERVRTQKGKIPGLLEFRSPPTEAQAAK